MTSDLWGASKNKVDSKGRIIIPAAWRPQLTDPVFLCPGINGNCIFILPNWRWAEIKEKLTRVTYDNEKGMALQRLFGSGTEAKIDGQGRLLVPEELRQRACIWPEATVILSGGFDRIEVWNPDLYRQFWEEHLHPQAVRECASSMQL